MCHAGSAEAAGPAIPTVRLQAGVLHGIHFGAKPTDVAFVGIPYAAPPIGALRWKPPLSAGHWPGARDATRFGAACPQSSMRWLPHLDWSEDCLYLNVWTPRLAGGARLPVIVYFHGGSNRAGDGRVDPLGPALAPLGVVFVSANYRLGALGFLAHPALSAESMHHSSGNYGLLDQLQVLAWVRDNIARFGGEPGQVTLMGQSAGAVDICLLMSSPMAAGLFKRAILESGDCLSSRTPQRDTADAAGRHMVAHLGVPEGPNMLRQLRSVAADKILRASENPDSQSGAIVDGWLIPEQPVKVFAAGRQLHVPVIVGSNADEATVFGQATPTTIHDYKNQLHQEAGRYWPEMFRAYPAASDSEVPSQSVRLTSDGFAFGAYETARAMTLAGQRSYWYYFSFADSGKRAALGAFHGEELQFLSDTFPEDWQRGPDEQALGRIMRAYWVQFAKTGDPNGSGLPDWTPINLKQPRLLELGRHLVRMRAILPRLKTMNRIMWERLKGGRVAG
ncbi:MAG TPA: carboxylesterase family protein [Steroidobacteraceae bacterium]|nr:carboxylesterase family protein [Steroidobacteraceae bacterium]